MIVSLKTDKRGDGMQQRAFIHESPAVPRELYWRPAIIDFNGSIIVSGKIKDSQIHDYKAFVYIISQNYGWIKSHEHF